MFLEKTNVKYLFNQMKNEISDQPTMKLVIFPKCLPPLQPSFPQILISLKFSGLILLSLSIRGLYFAVHSKFSFREAMKQVFDQKAF